MGSFYCYFLLLLFSVYSQGPRSPQVLRVGEEEKGLKLSVQTCLRCPSFFSGLQRGGPAEKFGWRGAAKRCSRVPCGTREKSAGLQGHRWHPGVPGETYSLPPPPSPHGAGLLAASPRPPPRLSRSKIHSTISWAAGEVHRAPARLVSIREGRCWRRRS